MLEDIRKHQDDGILLNFLGTPTKFIPRLSLIVADHPEIMKIAGVIDSTKGSGCRFCMQKIDYTNNKSLAGVGEKRTTKKMKKVYEDCFINNILSQKEFDEFCLYPWENLFWQFHDFDVYQMGSCRMHGTDHGLFERLLKFVENFITKNGSIQISLEFDRRFQELPAYPGLKKFNCGVFQLTNVRAYEHRSISVCLPWILNNLHPEIGPFFKLSLLYLEWRTMLSLDEINDEDLKLLDDKGKELLNQFLLVSDLVTTNKIQSMPKVILLK